MAKRTTRSALKILDRVTGEDKELRALIVQETLNCRIARMIYNARKHSGITQAQLAEAVGTTQSVIARLEDADYEGHSLSMLQRIAEALHQRITIHFEPVTAERSTTPQSRLKESRHT